ncbi:MAG: hypothetical protein LBH47_01305 [Christensenellaceae bacterium]|jgi:hypothetical protein|nr:hypothetical protein [Christensenellaceae bacterium]
MAQKEMRFKLSGDEEIATIMAVIKGSGESPANFLRKACGLPIRKQGKRYDLADLDKNMNIVYVKAKTWADKDGFFEFSYARKKETGLSKLAMSLAMMHLVEQGYLEFIGDIKDVQQLSDMKYRITAISNKGGVK